MRYSSARLPPVAVALLLAITGCQSHSQQSPTIQSRALETVDVILSGGTVFDGTGAAGKNLDVVIRDDVIVYVGEDAGSAFTAERTLDVSGLIVAPGFIDPHTHAGSDLSSDDPGRRANLPFAFQGVTTVVTGNDGFGSFDIAGMASAASEQGIGTNVAYLVGFGSVRREVLGTQNRAPDAAELSVMGSLTRQAMCEGAWGLSAGLYYVPQSYSETSEVIALARIAGQLGGYYDTHMRDESTYNVTVEGALSEAIRIGQEAEIPVHIAHIKALGPEVWGHSTRMIAMVEKARASGLRVTADQYPWEASGTRISNALVPRWALEGGLGALRERLKDKNDAAKIREGITAGLARRGGAERLLITGRLGDAVVPVGVTLADFAALSDLSPAEAAIAILNRGDARLASFNMDPRDILAFAQREWVVTGSDGSTGHPRKYASFPKAYRDLVMGEPGMDLARFIHRSSGQTARIVGLDRRGLLKQGHFADILVFDPGTFAPNATYASPRELSSGVVHLFVNGEAVISGGEYTGSVPGRPLLKDTPC